MAIERKIIESIDKKKDDIIKFLRELISFPSVTGNEIEIQKFIRKKLKEMGLKVDMWEPDHNELKKHPGYVPVKNGYTDRPNLVGIYKGTGNGKSLLFNGHVDVIPAKPLNAWKHKPWAGDIQSDRMYGRGASDMKSGLAAMTMALDILIKLGINLKGDVILEYTVDEEQSGNGTLACVLKGYKADAGISCETSSLHIQPACIGRIWFEIIIKGKPTGIQRAWEGVNAIEKGYSVMKAVSNFGDIRVNKLSHPLYPNVKDALPCMVSVFRSGSFPSSFPDICLLKGSFATLPGEDTNIVKQNFIKHILSFSKKDFWLKNHPPMIKFTGYCGEPSEISPNHPIVSVINKKYRRVIGKKPLITGREGAADIRYLIKYGDTPSVIFGPGLSELMHSTDEYVNISDLISATKILSLTILEWCGYE